MKKIIVLNLIIFCLTFYSYAQIDSLKILKASCPADSAVLGINIKPNILIKNCGTNALNNIDVTYSINGGYSIVETISQYINVNDSIAYTFSQGYTVTDSINNICFTVSYNSFADTLCKNELSESILYDLRVGDVISHSPDYIVDLYDTVNFQVRIYNCGLNPISDFLMEYQIGSLNPIQEICIDTIPAGDSLDYTFATPLVVNYTTAFGFCSGINHSLDQIPQNDEICVFFGINSIMENQSKEHIDFNIYPNPAHSFITLINKAYNEEDVRIIIYDIDGKLVYESKGVFNTNDTVTIDVSNLSKGVYNIVVQSDKRTMTKKLLISK